MDSLKSKIAASTAFQGFMAEHEACKIFGSLGWNAKHGAYYEDIDSKKQREIDVIASQVWQRNSKEGTQYARLTVLVEVKSMKGFHLLVSSFEDDGFSFFQNTHWIGDPGGDYLELCSALRDGGMADAEVSKFAKRLHQFAYPRQKARPFLIMVRPNTEMVFTSFRETNIGTDKDLDNSVFWRASQSLKSASKSIQRSIFAMQLDHIAGSVKYAPKSEARRLDCVFSWAKEEINRIDLIHPIVVTDADIWTASTRGPEVAKWARFGTYSYYGIPEWWCDVVNSKFLKEYAQVVSSHYSLELKAARAKLQA